MALFSILGLYNTYPEVFSEMVLPDGINRDILINNIVSELAELELLYSSPLVMQKLIAVWSAKNKYNWAKLYDTLNFEYNPIDNYDRTEEETINDTKNINGTATQNATQTNDLLIASDNVHKVSAFNATGFNNAESDTGSVNNSGTVTNDINSTSETSEKIDNVRKMRAYGNIGVTTTQEMIKQEREISEFNIYDYITDSFKHRFCILVY